jgi:hypothetical protein
MIFNLVSYGIKFYLSRPRGTKTGIRIGTLENKKKIKKKKIFLKRRRT